MKISRKYGVILADPAWRYRNFSDAAHGAAIVHYDGMSVEELCAIPMGKWAADDCVLVLWATWPKLDEAMVVIAAWGFEYVTGWPWVKTVPERGTIKRGIGFWAMSASEPLLIARRGAPRRAKASMIGLLAGEHRIFYAPRARHSAKPRGVQDWVEAVLPGPYLELFARKPRPGWTCWGDELGYKLSACGVERKEVVQEQNGFFR